MKIILEGIDLSHWNKITNYNALLAEELGFVILKAGGHEGVLHKDKTFEERYGFFKKHSIPVGCYFYVDKNFNNAMTGREYAQEFAAMIKGKTFECGVWLDNEETSSNNKSGATDAAINFCNEMERQGYYVGIYGSEISVFKDRYQLDRLDAYAKWVARYPGRALSELAAPPNVRGLAMWQYTSTGIVKGISGGVDKNRMYQDLPSVIVKKKLDGSKNK